MNITKIVRKGDKNTRVQLEDGTTVLVKTPATYDELNALVGKDVSTVEKTEAVTVPAIVVFQGPDYKANRTNRGLVTLVCEDGSTIELKGRAATKLWSEMTTGVSLTRLALVDYALGLGMSSTVLPDDVVMGVDLNAREVPEALVKDLDSEIMDVALAACTKEHDLPSTSPYSDL